MTPEVMLLKAVKDRHYNGIKRAFERTANVNAVDEAGWTSLHHAANRGFDDIVDLLLSHVDIDVTAETPQHETARDLAFLNCHEGIVRKLNKRLPGSCQLDHLAGQTRSRMNSVNTKGRQRSLFD